MSMLRKLLPLLLAAACSEAPVAPPDAGPPPVCGNGVVEAGEACDTGPENSDRVANSCRTTCVLPSCGDGIVDTGVGEECDGSAPQGGSCTDACQLIRCGDGVAEEGEACDDGADNSDTAADACRTSCVAAGCGDATVDTGEACDDGNSINGDGCDADCRIEPLAARPYATCEQVGEQREGLVCASFEGTQHWMTPCAGATPCEAPWERCESTPSGSFCLPSRCETPFHACETGLCLPAIDPISAAPRALCFRTGTLSQGRSCVRDRDACGPGLVCVVDELALAFSCVTDADCLATGSLGRCSRASGTCEATGTCEDPCDPLRPTSADEAGCSSETARCVPSSTRPEVGRCTPSAPTVSEACLREGVVQGALTCAPDTDGALRWLSGCTDDAGCPAHRRCESGLCRTNGCSDGTAAVGWGAACSTSGRAGVTDGVCLMSPTTPSGACWHAGERLLGEACDEGSGAASVSCAPGLACVASRCRVTCDLRAPDCRAHGASASCRPTGVGRLPGAIVGLCVDAVDGEDPYFPFQWHLEATGANRALPGEDARVSAAWAAGIRGEGTTVAIVDDGLEIAHEDLWQNVVPGVSHDYVTGDSDPTGGDHGTSCGGVAASRDANAVGGRGVAPRAGLVGFNVLEADDSANELDAETRALDTVDVYSNSWGPPDGAAQLTKSESTWRQGIETGIARGRGGLGAIYTWAAGNGGDDGEDSNYDGYANFHGVMAIGAVGADGRRADYSEPGANVWICTPSMGDDGIGIVTTDRTGSEGYNDGATRGEPSNANYTATFSGTSSATPVAAAAAALVIQSNPTLSWRDVRLVLAASARRSPKIVGWTTNGAGVPISRECGFGVVDAGAAAALAKAWTPVPPMKRFSGPSAAPMLAIPDDNVAGVRTRTTIRGSGIESIEFVAIHLTSEHTYIGDLEVVLRNETTGTESVLATKHSCRGPCAPYDDWRFGSVRHLGERADGVWSLFVRDVGAKDTGQIQSWRLVFYGH